MKKNMGSADKMIRLLLVVVVLILMITGVVSGVWAVILGILAAVFLITSFVGFCPLYYPFGLSTKKEKKEA